MYVFNKNEIIIIGWGVTGKATGNALHISNYVDLYNELHDYQLKQAKCFILCLPTPTVKGKQDNSIIETWLKKIKALKTDPIVIIRSTILPGTTDKLAKKYRLNLVFVPEFLNEATAIEDAKAPEILIVGSRDILIRETVKDLFFPLAAKRVILTDPVTAETIKYTMNSFFGLKVIFGNQIWDIAKKVGANYEQIVLALETHKWGSKNGWNIWQGGYRGYGGKCLPKDIEAFVEAFKSPLLEKVQQLNQQLLKEKE